MVPNGWTLMSLGKLCDINPKKIKKPENGKVSFIAMNQLSEEGQIITHLPREYEEVSKGFTSFKDGDVLVAKITPCFENGKGALVQGLTNGVGFGSTEFHVLRAKENTSPEFIYYLTRTKELRVRGENNMQGSAGHRRVTADYFNAYKVLTPPLPEQRKIANILSTWDKAISTTERLVDNSKQQKKALMQQLLTGKKRLLDDSGKPFEGEWLKVELGKLLDYKQPTPYLVKSTDYSDDYLIPVLTAGKTFILGYSNEDFGIFEEELPAIIFDDFTTASKFVDFPFKAKSSAMKILVAKQGVSIKFVYEAMQVMNYPVGGHQRHWISIFANLVIGLPSLLEQQKIASVLTNADKEIELLERQLVDLKQEKKALMQQLLTGKRRVKVDEEAVA